MTQAEAAIGYAKRGVRIFPVKWDGSKEPLTPHGFKDATFDEGTIRRWWSKWPNAWIGRPTGPDWFVLDVDDRSALAELETEHGFLPDTRRATTPRGGLHFYLRGETSCARGGLPQGIDVRGAGGYVVVPPSPGYEWQSEADVAEAPAWLMKLLNADDRRNGSAPPVAGVIAKGERNNTLTSMAGTMRRRGFSLGAIEAALLHEYGTRCEKDATMSETDVRKIAASIGRKPTGDDLRQHERQRNGHRPRSATLRVLDTRRLVETEPPPLNWIADGIYAEGRFSLVGGREKGGKSLVQLALAVCAASGGGRVAGIVVRPARVLLVDAENGEREIHRRLRAIGLAPAHAENLVVVEARGFELRANLADVVELIDEHDPGLVLLDSFRSLWRGSERDEAEVAEALDPVRELAHDRAIGISLTHHAQRQDGQEYRGSSAIGACVDWVVMLSRDREDKDRRRRRLSNPLARFARERDDRWLALCSSDDDGPVTVKAAEPFHRPKPRDEKTQAVLDVLAEEVQSEREIAEASGVSRSTTQRILRDLEAAKAATREAGGWVAHVAHPYIRGGPPGPPPGGAE